MIEVKSKEIGSHTYHVRQLGAKQGRAALTKLLNLAGNAFGGNPAAFFTSLSEQDLEYFCRVFGENTEVELALDRRIPLFLQQQEDHFAGQFGEMLEWLVFCVEINFSSFLDALAKLKARMEAGTAAVATVKAT